LGAITKSLFREIINKLLNFFENSQDPYARGIEKMKYANTQIINTIIAVAYKALGQF